jgi:hypothetical protein
MARDGPKTQTEKKQKHPITATIQDFLTIDFISLPPFLRSMGLKKKTSTSRQFSRFRFLSFRVSLIWRTVLKIKLEPLKESGLIFPGMKWKWFGRKNGKDFQYQQKAVG